MHPGGGEREVLQKALAILQFEGLTKMGDTFHGDVVPAQAAQCGENQTARGCRAAHLPNGTLSELNRQGSHCHEVRGTIREEHGLDRHLF